MAKKAANDGVGLDAIARELRSVKWLIAAYLIRDGMKRSDVAAVLEVDAAVVSRAIPKTIRPDK